MKLRKLIFLLSIICCVSKPVISNAQTATPFGNPPVTNDPPPPPPDPIDVPLDGGLSILIATGVLYGIKKARNNNKNE